MDSNNYLNQWDALHISIIWGETKTKHLITSSCECHVVWCLWCLHHLKGLRKVFALSRAAGDGVGIKPWYVPQIQEKITLTATVYSFKKGKGRTCMQQHKVYQEERCRPVQPKDRDNITTNYCVVLYCIDYSYRIQRQLYSSFTPFPDLISAESSNCPYVIYYQVIVSCNHVNCGFTGSVVLLK